MAYYEFTNHKKCNSKKNSKGSNYLSVKVCIILFSLVKVVRKTKENKAVFL